MIYFSGFAPQTTSIESQTHRDLTGSLSVALTSSSPSGRAGTGTPRHSCDCGPRSGQGVCVPSQCPSSRTNPASPVQLEFVTFQTFHACLVPAVGLPRLWTVFIGERLVANDSPVFTGNLGSPFPTPYCSGIYSRNFVLHIRGPFNREEHGL